MAESFSQSTVYIFLSFIYEGREKKPTRTLKNYKVIFAAFITLLCEFYFLESVDDILLFTFYISRRKYSRVLAEFMATF